MNCCTSTACKLKFLLVLRPPRTRWRGRRRSNKASHRSASWRDTSKLFISTLFKKGRPCPWLPSRALSLSTCTIHVPSRRKKLRSTRCHWSARLTYALHISIFLHDTSTLMLDVPHVGKRVNKAHVLNERVEEHRFPTIEKEQQTSWWSVCTHSILYYLAI